MDTLGLSSPLTHGDRVKNAQKRLAGSNVFKTNYHPGVQDGVYGQTTARASKRAKYWIGYPLHEIKGIYGSSIDGYLSGEKKLPPAYAERRKNRLTAIKATPLRQKALNQAISQIGTKEAPAGSNHVKYGVWYGMDRQSWCAMFVTWCYVQVGSKAFRRGQTYAYVPYIVHDAHAGHNFIAVTHDPQPGDAVCYDWDKDGVADHVGLFEEWINKSRGTFRTVEGNTAVGNDSNGGEVMRRERNLTQVQVFAHCGL
jgi:peptidoglycan hydrolase-like protein with peptidoglycan-binding domain